MRVFLAGLWLWVFLAVKLSGGLAAWSWWWVLCPVVPDVALMLTKLGWV